MLIVIKIPQRAQIDISANNRTDITGKTKNKTNYKTDYKQNMSYASTRVSSLNLTSPIIPKAITANLKRKTRYPKYQKKTEVSGILPEKARWLSQKIYRLQLIPIIRISKIIALTSQHQKRNKSMLLALGL